MGYLSKAMVSLVSVVLLAVAMASTARASDPYWDKKDREAAATRDFNRKMDDYNFYKQKDLQRIDREADARRAANRPLENNEWWESVQRQLNAAAKKKTYQTNPYQPVQQAPVPSYSNTRPLPPSAVRDLNITQNKAARDAHFQELMRRSTIRR